MSVETIAILSAIIGALLDLITAFVVVGALYILFQLAYGIEWIIVSIKARRKSNAPTGAEGEGEHAE